MSQFSILPYTTADNEGAKALCRIPVSGNIVLSLEREEDYLAGAFLQCEQPDVYVCRETKTGQVCGLFNVGFRRVFVNGEVRTQRYFSDLRIAPAFQKSRLFYQIIRYVTQNNLVPVGQEAAQTIVFTDNAVFQNMIQKRKDNSRFPKYHFANDYFTHIVSLSSPKNPFQRPSLRRSPVGQYKPRKATINDASLMQSFLMQHAPEKQSYPFYDYLKMETPYYNGLKITDYYLAFEADELVGFCAKWHQKDIKQTRIVGYSRLFSIVRPLANAFSKLFGGFQLPPAGTVLNYFYVHNILISINRADVFEALLHAIFEEYKRHEFAYFMVGLCQNDALLTVFEKVKNKRTVQGKLYWVNDGTPPETFMDKRQIYVDIGRI